jgi:lipopolysaccharide transport system permease protein
MKIMSQNYNQKSGNPITLSNITIYTPDSPIRHPARMLHDMFRDLFSGRELAWQLALRDIRAQYRQTAW